MLCKIGNLGKSFEMLKILLDLETNVSEKTAFGFSIRLAIKNKKPAVQIIDMIKDQAQDNHEAVARVVGEALTQKIISL
jgi:hypothetical protein